MKALIAGLGTVVLGASLSSSALAQQAIDSIETPAPGTPNEPAPPADRWVYSYPTGRWVYTSDNGWVWVPYAAAPKVVDSVPYVYLYTPRFGWNWYVSPWGWGPYHYGAWVVHPWRPLGWNGGWVARPHVVVRLGGTRFQHR